MSFEQETDHAALALARLVEQFKGRARLEGLISALLGPLQDVEDQLALLYADRWISTADGVQLDALGALVGQPREGRDDTEYRVWIAARVVANRSNGHPDDTLQILELITPTADYSLTEFPPAAYLVETGDLAISAESVYQILTLAKPAGVRLNLLYNPDTATTFTLSDDPDTTDTGDSDKGLGDTGNPATGGQLAGIL